MPTYFDFRVSMTGAAGRSLVGFGGATASIAGAGGRERFLLGSGVPDEEERREITSIRVVEVDIIGEWGKGTSGEWAVDDRMKIDYVSLFVLVLWFSLAFGTWNVGRWYRWACPRITHGGVIYPSTPARTRVFIRRTIQPP